MKSIKGFVTIASSVNNTPGVQGVLGELSTLAKTFSPEIGEYSNSSMPELTLLSFKCEEAATGVKSAVTNSQATQILTLVNHCIAYNSTHVRPFDPNDLVNYIRSQFNAAITGLQLGEFVDNGTIALPSWISWTSVINSGNTIKIWLSNDAFIEQYDEYTIKVVAPLDTLDTLWSNYAAARTSAESVTLAQLSDKIVAKRDGQPETVSRMYEFTCYNPNNTQIGFVSKWAVLVYGAAGDNQDRIKEALTTYLLDNSSKTMNQWRIVYPDIFSTMEFILVPRWDKIAVENMTSLSSLYASMLNLSESIAFAKTVVTEYPAEHINTRSYLLPIDYKAVSIVVIDGVDNIAPGTETIQAFIPDYLPFNTTDVDFGRMTHKTQRWVIFIMNLLTVAETMGASSVISDNTVHRVVRSGTIYAASEFDGITFLVAAKHNAQYSA